VAPRLRRYRSPGLIIPALAISVTAQSAALLGYQLTRPIPNPVLTIRLDDAASSWEHEVVTHSEETTGTAIRVTGPKGFKVTVATPAGELVGSIPQRFELSERTPDVRVTVNAPDGGVWTRRITITPKQETQVALGFTPSRGQVLVTRIGEKAPFARCNQARCPIELPSGTEVTLSAVLGERATFGGYHQYPMRTPPELVGILGDPLAKCGLGDVVTAATEGNVFDCSLTVRTDTDVSAEFGLQPEEIDVALEVPKVPDLIKPLTPRAPPAPIEAEKLDDKPLQVALAPPPKQAPPPPLPPPPPPPEAPKPPEPQQPPPPNMVMVEVDDDKSVVDKAPDDAKQLSDKNRDVAEESRATQTNLDKESKGKEVASRESDDRQSPEIGGPDDKIRQLEDTKPTTDQRIRETDHSGKSETATGAIKGEGGDDGDQGTGESRGVLAMRGIDGRGSIVDNGKDGRKAGRRGTPGLNTPLSFQDYERIMGKDRIDEERQVAARKMSNKKGRWERKLEAVKSSLENFVPDVRPGNQTALKTRAHPFALYIARMHRRIHELWGFGFLESLDEKGSNYPLNDPNLWVNLELSVNPDGTVHKVTIAKTSGKTEFDVAAIDTVLTAGPYEATPEAIRSVDGRIYLRWGFYRNWRQCGTFNVEPYILTEVPDDGGVGHLDDGALVKNTAKLPGKRKDKPQVGSRTVTPDDGLANQKVSPDSSVTDKQALFAANLWVSAFATAQVDKLVSYSTVPFYAGGKIAASNSTELKEMYSGLVVESGAMKDWKLLTPGEYTSGRGELPEGNLVLQVRTAKESFAVVLSRTKSGDYRATQLAR
jgi:TonB family protein